MEVRLIGPSNLSGVAKRAASCAHRPALSMANKWEENMSTWLSEREQRLVAGAEAASAATPIPTQIVSNGEYLPPPQSATQKKGEARIDEPADVNSKHLGLSPTQLPHPHRGLAG